MMGLYGNSIFMKTIFTIELILFIPFLILQILIVLKKKKNYNIKKLRNKYFHTIIILHIKFFHFLFTVCRKIFISFIINTKPTINNSAIINHNKINYDNFCNAIKRQHPDEFELFTANLYKGLGYKVEVMPKGPDGGKDVILEDRNGKVYIECKHYGTSTVGREICQKLVGAATADGITRMKVFTCGKIHTDATKYAEKFKNNENIDFEIIDIDKMYQLYIMSKTSNDQLYINTYFAK